MSSNFRSYTIEVDFEGLSLPLPNTYRYITRDKHGFVCAWRERPKLDTWGCYVGGEELPITMGHDRDSVGEEPAIRKYRRGRMAGIISKFGVVPTR